MQTYYCNFANKVCTKKKKKKKKKNRRSIDKFPQIFVNATFINIILLCILFCVLIEHEN